MNENMSELGKQVVSEALKACQEFLSTCRPKRCDELAAALGAEPGTSLLDLFDKLVREELTLGRGETDVDGIQQHRGACHHVGESGRRVRRNGAHQDVGAVGGRAQCRVGDIAERRPHTKS